VLTEGMQLMNRRKGETGRPPAIAYGERAPRISLPTPRCVDVELIEVRSLK